MKTNTKMLLMRGKQNDNRYEPENRFRDDRGREHYDNGHYAPMRGDYTGDLWAENRRRRDYGRNNYDETGYREGREPMGIIGFDTEMRRQPQEYRTDYRMDAGYHMEEPEYSNRQTMRGYAEGAEQHLSRQAANAWAQDLENEDGSHGAHWTLEQAKQVMAQKGVACEPLDFWLALNLIYSDYCKVLRKYGVGDKIDLYVDLAKAFLCDADAYPDKLARYYEYIVRR